jgi:hypothetical protein
MDLNLNWDDLDWNNFSCVDMARKIKDAMSAKLNAMTPEERHKYFSQDIDDEIQQVFPNLKYANT